MFFTIILIGVVMLAMEEFQFFSLFSKVSKRNKIKQVVASGTLVTAPKISRVIVCSRRQEGELALIVKEMYLSYYPQLPYLQCTKYRLLFPTAPQLPCLQCTKYRPLFSTAPQLPCIQCTKYRPLFSTTHNYRAYNAPSTGLFSPLLQTTVLTMHQVQASLFPCPQLPCLQ